MSFLLDTHALLWWLADAPELSERARRVIEDRGSAVFVSPVSAYEIGNKIRLGKLQRIPRPLRDVVAEAGFRDLPIRLAHAVAAAELPGLHRDPWDRLLVAQALTEGLEVVTADEVFGRYGVEVVW